MAVGPCDCALVLGSGFGAFAQELEVEARYPYGMLQVVCAGVPGHQAELLIGRWRGWRLALFCGRFHGYQGLTSHQTSLPVQLAAQLGCGRVLLTNAVGAIRTDIQPGDFMLVTDHLNLQGDNPLRGISPPAFVDLSSLYQQAFYPALQQRLTGSALRLHRGVLAAVPGPSYETSAEVRMLRQLGADAVSMSLVAEAIMAHFLGLEVAAVSLATNLAAGLDAAPLCHEDVLRCGCDSRSAFSLLLEQLLPLFVGQAEASD
ncbi:MAG: purine-nucleoside phosphorylase [Desulfuromonadaceae bacterium]|nr:purine-nucleoside phosphorylase [Desulfuromonadaceae bacterium]